VQGFSAANRLGSGGYGPVFRGVLDGVPVAVKLLDTSGCSSQGPKEFASEVAILSRLHHPHIVLLMGSCPERCGLVYELLDHGSLEQHLFSSSMPDLAWQVRGEACAAAMLVLLARCWLAASHCARLMACGYRSPLGQ
jgi:serine/threonine protein kinase